MKDTGFSRAGGRRLAPGDAVSPTAGGRARAEPESGAGRQQDVYFSGAGGMVSTAEDYLQFAQMLLNGGELNGKRYPGPARPSS